jgi:hypothetical protein
MTEKQNFTNAFAPAIWQYLIAYNSAKDKLLKRKLKEAIIDSLKKWSDRSVDMISAEVQKLAKNSKNINNPFDLLWKDRYKLGKRKKDNKSNIVFEHTTPLKDFFDSLTRCNNIVKLKKSLNSYSGVCLITRKEDNALNSKKYRSGRPGGWAKCYKECKITIINKK